MTEWAAVQRLLEELNEMVLGLPDEYRAEFTPVLHKFKDTLQVDHNMQEIATRIEKRCQVNPKQCLICNVYGGHSSDCCVGNLLDELAKEKP